MNTKTEILKEFDEKFNLAYKKEVDGWLGNVSIEELQQFISTSLDQVRKEGFEEGQKNKGQAKREAYQMGYRETQREIIEKVNEILKHYCVAQTINARQVCKCREVFEALTKLKGEKK